MRKISEAIIPFLALFFIGIQPVSGQDFHPFPDGDIRLFDRMYEYEFLSPGLQLQGTEMIGSAEKLILNPNTLFDLQGGLAPCVHVFGNWWADEVYIDAGVIVLKLMDQTEIAIDTELSVGEVSEAGTIDNGLFMQVELTAFAEETVAGFTDSFKTFTLMVYESDGISPVENHPFNGTEVIIGKNIGLLGSFPYNFVRLFDPYSLPGTIFLTGVFKSHDELKPSHLDLFPFAPGDELHVLTTFTTGPPENSQTKQKFTFIGRDYDAENQALTLDFIREEVYWYNNFGEVESHEKRDTGQWKISPEKYINFDLPSNYPDRLPSEPTVIPWDAFSQDIHFYNIIIAEQSYYNRKEVWFFEENVLLDTIDCNYAVGFKLTLDDELRFIEGLGGPYFTRGGHAEYSRKPVYSYVDGIKWGVPFEFTVSTEEFFKEKSVSLFPNPVLRGESISIKSSYGNFNEIALVSSDGKIVYHRPLPTETDFAEIETQRLVPGKYLLQITYPEGHLLNKWLVVLE